jgi:hypothetical protein
MDAQPKVRVREREEIQKVLLGEIPMRSFYCKEFTIGDREDLSGFVAITAETAIQAAEIYRERAIAKGSSCLQVRVKGYGVFPRGGQKWGEQKDLAVLEPLPTEEEKDMVGIPKSLYRSLERLGIVGAERVRSRNVGASDYAQKIIQPWAICLDSNLDPWDADIIKRVLRKKAGEPRRLTYEKIQHICDEKLRQIKLEEQGSE